MAWTPQTRLWRRRFATGRRPLAVRAAPSRPDDVTVRREQDHSWQLQALISTVAPKLTDAGRHSEQPPYEPIIPAWEAARPRCHRLASHRVLGNARRGRSARRRSLRLRYRTGASP